jgi:gentisate 1,2-dioxygenase
MVGTGSVAGAPRFEERTAPNNLFPLWEHTTQTGQPRPEEACIWRWSDVQRLFGEAADATSTSESERRVLLMGNPAFRQQQKLKTTQTLQGAYQVLMPGESARPHRHTPSALRFMLEDGGETYTVVDGKDCRMQRNDIVLTPANSWHSHYHNGSEPSVWFDALDSVLIGYLDCGFFEPSSKLWRFPDTASDDAFPVPGLCPVLDEGIATAYSPRFRFPWEETLRALDAAPQHPDGTATLRLMSPCGSGMAMWPMDSFVTRLSSEASRARRTTSSALCVVACGSGVSRIGDAEISWSERDVFTIPHWAWASHRATSDDAVIFMVTDRGYLDRLGFLRDEMA